MKGMLSSSGLPLDDRGQLIAPARTSFLLCSASQLSIRYPGTARRRDQLHTSPGGSNGDTILLLELCLGIFNLDVTGIKFLYFIAKLGY